MPLWLVDLTLWQSDRSDETYDEFLRDSVPYSPPPWRAFYERHKHSPSAVSKLEIAFSLHQPDEAQATLRSSAASLARVLRTLMVFRGRHFGIARKAYHEEVRLYESGSGGGVPNILLKAVLDLTRENEGLVRHQAHRRMAGTAGEPGCERPSPAEAP